MNTVVDVSYHDLVRHRSRVPEFRALLSPEEAARAARLAIPSARERFILRHGILREALAARRGEPPGSLHFVHAGDGKPSLADGGPGFNLSKADDGLLIAMADGAAVGCDLEALRPSGEAKAIAARWFSPGEREALGRLQGEAYDRAFLRFWVRKEALLKAAGTGLQGSLSVDTGGPEPMIEARPVSASGTAFWLADLEPVSGFLAAVAADRPMTLRLAVHV